MNYEEYKLFKVRYPEADNEVIPRMFKCRVIETQHPSAIYDNPNAWQRLFTDGHNIVWNDLRDRKTKQIDLSKMLNVGDIIWAKAIVKYNLTIGGQKWSLSPKDEPHLIYEPRYYFVSKVK